MKEEADKAVKKSVIIRAEIINEQEKESKHKQIKRAEAS